MGKQQRTKARRSTLPLPRRFSDIGEGLIDQQMWFWGCDVRYPAGNLLVEYGFGKRASPQPRFHSAYSHDSAVPNAVLTLWGWGLWVAAPERGSLFLNRNHCRARWTESVTLLPDAWQERDLPRGAPVEEVRFRDAYDLLQAALKWIASYERWVIEVTSSRYRSSALESWPMRRRFRGGIAPNKVADHWEVLAETVRGYGSQGDSGH